MEVAIKYADEFAIPRISQLTQRTNQFNLTTKRYLESEIKGLSQSEAADVFYLSLKDRFGESGIVGVAIMKYLVKKALIDTFLLSCRVIGRGVEDVFIKACIDAAAERGSKKVIGLYTPTKKNGIVEGFYKSHHFSFVEKNNGTAKYSFPLTKTYPDFSDYFKSIRINDKEYLVAGNSI